MTMPPVRRPQDGRALLCVWRSGGMFEMQNHSALQSEWNSLRFSDRPRAPRDGTWFHDLTKPLPYPDRTFDAVYSYHMLEHLTPDEGLRFVRELARVSRPGSVVRVSVPDLEGAVRAYLKALEDCSVDPGPDEWTRYDWATYELFEQMVRDEGGGLMKSQTRAGHVDPEYLFALFGDTCEEFDLASPAMCQAGRDLRRFLEERRTPIGGPRPSWLLARRILGTMRRRLRGSVARLSGRPPRASHGRHPRETREAVYWMYDRFSLSRLLAQAGLVAIRAHSHAESDIPGWERYQLDRSNYGDHPIDRSIYLEGRTPEAPAPTGSGPAPSASGGPDAS